ncbi:MAG: tRNA pseudouridine(55) synthase TruB [bacterium]|nr:tRNA pseudouridine(55) synthase TruB [bacterium]
MSGNRRPEAVALLDLDGILVIDKPADMSSARVVAVVKKVLKARKVGHAGTLDPFAEGVLICCINQATRIAGFLLHGSKKYVAELKLGVETDTQDLTGIVVSTARVADLSQQTIQSVVESFKGPIEQLPPVYSALKHNGVPLYKLARRGRPVQKPPRQVKIYDIRVIDVDLPYVRFEVSCSAGTYIRALGADIGKKLDCGGHLSALKRTASSGFTLNQAIPLPALEESARSGQLSSLMISMKDALPDIPEISADEHLEEKIRHGQMLTTNDLTGTDGTLTDCRAGDYLKIVDREQDLVAIVEQNTAGDRLTYSCVFPKRAI